MRIFLGYADGPIRWLLQPNPRRILNNRLGPDHRLVNLQVFGVGEPHCEIVRDGVIVQTHSIGVVPIGVEQGNEASNLLQSGRLASMAQALRYASRQAEIGLRRSVGAFKLQDLKPYRPGAPLNREWQHMDRYRVDTAVTAAHVRIAHDVIRADEIPVAHTILLDAIAAFTRFDYRQAILYAAMASEAVLTDWLESVHERTLKRGSRRGRHRVIRLNTPNGEVAKDPVYDRLSEGTSFSRLLHERPLYVAGRSVMIEHHELYREAVGLYKTRNSIVHEGDTRKPDLLNLDISGGRRALTCAIKLFAWVGQGTGYVIPGMESRQFKPAALLIP